LVIFWSYIELVKKSVSVHDGSVWCYCSVAAVFPLFSLLHIDVL